ncbi:MAG: DNA repair protein RecN [Flavobacteriaceae bacterium]|nr:DNA repair protein RecN [Flavobacteriaceae bacterium]
MITKLSIKNYALIDDISVDFSDGLTIITGETGAGKSILLGALSLLLGKRADLKSIRNDTKKCIIEGEFKFTDANTERIFDKNNLDYDAHSIIRRELLPSGKSRAFVNDTPVTLQQLQNLAPYLIDIHSQHDTLELFSETFQLEIIDALVENSEIIKKYQKKLNSFNEVSETINDLIYKKESAVKELDYNSFLYKELTEEHLETLNQESLEESFQVLNNSETIQESLSQIIKLLSSDEIGSLETLKETRLITGSLREYSAKYEEIWKRLDSVVIELEDVSEEIENTITTVEVDPLLLAEVNQKLQGLYKLQQKHSVETIEELLEIQSSLALKIEITNNLDEKIKQLKNQQEKLESDLLLVASIIREKRIKIIPVLKERLKKYLSELGLPNANFKFDFTTSEKFRKNGTDVLQLLFTANKGMPFGTIKKVASGGELSRLMLSIKAVLAQYKKLPTLVFDEIDAGVSGEISYKMASILKEMSATMQMFCITHLPQVAAKGDHHIKIHKEIINNTTITKLQVLNNKERVNELAEMIGGKNHTKTAITQAMELLN